MFGNHEDSLKKDKVEYSIHNLNFQGHFIFMIE